MKKFTKNNYIGFYNITVKKVGEPNNFYETYILNPSMKQHSPADRLGNFAIFSLELLQDMDKAELYFKKALKKDPENSFWLGNYALFLHFYKKEYHKADFYYNKSLKINSKDPFLLFNYAYLNVNHLKNYEKADVLFKKAIREERDNSELYGAYAYFLYKIVKKYEQAEKNILKAIDLDDTNPLWYVLLAQLLIFKGNKKAAKDIISRGFDFVKKDRSVELEFWFLLYAHFYEEYAILAKKRIEDLIEKGVSIGDIDLYTNVLIAIKNNHPNEDELKDIAKKMANTLKNQTYSSK